MATGALALNERIMSKTDPQNTASSGWPRLGWFISREPLIHFVALAAMLFVVEYFWASKRKDTIVVDRQTRVFLINQREELALRKLTLSERKQVIEAFVRDEILYREAYKRGLDKDARMRRNLIRKMRGLELAKIKLTPTKAELRRFFEENRARYRRPPTLSLQHLYFRKEADLPDGLLARLRGGLDHTGVGTLMPGLGRSIRDAPARRLASIFGSNAARAILALKDRRWHGPITSPRGVHFVRIVERTPAVLARFEDVKRYLRSDWALAQSRLAIDRAVAALRANYEIIIEAEKPKP